MRELLLDSGQVDGRGSSGGTQSDLGGFLANNLVPGADQGHLRTITMLRNVSSTMAAKACCYPFDLDCHCFRGKNEKMLVNMYNMLYTMVYRMI